uniref:Uncharacterized protein n=1 Tax=Tetradesmus obliquus TaxID=3088 RepID=A0A383VP90_TETOB|eukprot:jgi/Sobl393_1/11573/SZX66991.1
MAMQGRTAVITGTARAAGIGQACAKLLYNKGYNIVGIDNAEHEFAADAAWHTAEQQAATAAAAVAGSAVAKSDKPQPRCAWLKVDLSQPDLILSVPEQMQQLGVKSVNVLVNNAGISNPYMQSDSLAERAALWQGYIATNLTAPFLLSEAVLPLMVQGEGSIIHVSSTRALQSERHSEGYAAAKAGLLGLTHAQAASLAPKRIRVNAVLPGWIDTSGTPEDITQEQHEWQWTGSVGSPADIAELVLFLADPAKSGFITGQHFVADGGVTKRMTYPE